MNIYWTGARHSDIRYTNNLFKGSITTYGNNKNGNVSFCKYINHRINHNVFSETADKFIIDEQSKILQNDNDAFFLPYNPNFSYNASKKIIEHTLCLNDETIMKNFDDKIKFHNFISDVIPTMNKIVMFGKEIKKQKFINEHIQNNSLVVQKPISSGGEGSYLITSHNCDEVLCKINDNEKYIVSEYIEENIPVNIHCIIFENDYLILPPSIQIIQQSNNTLQYRGADFISYKNIFCDENNNNIYNFKHKEFINCIEEICNKILSSKGKHYLGIIGFDAIITKNSVYVVEANNRFQASSVPLNRALIENHLPSLQELNLQAFGYIPRTVYQNDLENILVPYSYYIYVNENERVHANHIFKNCYNDFRTVDVSNDDYNISQKCEENAYLFNVIFNSNIVNIESDTFSINLHKSLTSASQEWIGSILKTDNISKIKIDLINQGVYIEKDAKIYLENNKNFDFNTTFNIDIKLCEVQGDTIFANCPTRIKFAPLSPYHICYDSKLYLTYYSKKILTIDCDELIYLPKLYKDSSKIKEIAFFATDRLRLQNSPSCIFNNTSGDRENNACKFCEVYGWNLDFNEHDIHTAIDYCFENLSDKFRHILIGGRSNYIGAEHKIILRMCEKIKKYNPHMPIYLMCLPPQNVDFINDYVNVGITEFGFNIEIYDRNIAKKFMPGKGEIPLKQYFNAFERAVSLLENKGAVRTAYIVGLEPEESLMQGISDVSKIGVAPILSAFRPIPGTPFENIAPLSSEQLYFYTKKAKAISNNNGIELGPECKACQNNTLNIL